MCVSPLIVTTRRTQSIDSARLKQVRTGKSIPLQFVQFFLVSVTVAVVRAPLIQVTHVPFGELARWMLGLSEQAGSVIGNYMSLVLAVIIGLFWNFFVNRFWTYRHAPRG